MGGPPQQPQRGQGDAPLTHDDWFPRPASEHDVELLDPTEDFDARTLFRLLTDDDAREWRHKVGVAGRADGSGKPSTRLLASRGVILKTNIALLEASADVLRARLVADSATGARARVWHPSKRLGLMRVHGGWLPVSACRELVTLRGIERLPDRLEAWTAMFDLGVEVFLRSGLGLDLNPANFALEDGTSPRGRLFYVDDEMYPALDLRQIAFAIAARIPEEPEADHETWTSWGQALGAMLDGRSIDRALIGAAISDYPLAEAFETSRDAVLRGLRRLRTTLRIGVRSFAQTERVCVIADVHANLPALEATLGAARELGAERFLFLGDAVGYGPHPRECVARLAELDGIFVGGNHDHAIATGRFDRGMNRLARACAEWTRDSLGAAEIEWLASLPREHRDEEWLAVHGAPRDPNRFFAYVYDLTFEENFEHLEEEGVKLCFCGHTHVQLVHVVLPSGPTKMRGTSVLDLAPRWPCLVNPGSVGQPRDHDPRAAFAIWDRATSRVTFERVSYDLTRTVRDLRAAALPSELSERLAQGT